MSRECSTPLPAPHIKLFIINSLQLIIRQPRGEIVPIPGFFANPCTEPSWLSGLRHISGSLADSSIPIHVWMSGLAIWRHPRILTTKANVGPDASYFLDLDFRPAAPLFLQYRWGVVKLVLTREEQYDSYSLSLFALSRSCTSNSRSSSISACVRR